MGKKNAFDNVNTEAAQSVGRESAEKPVSKMFRLNAQQDAVLREAMYLTGASMQQIVTEGIELWIAENMPVKK